MSEDFVPYKLAVKLKEKGFIGNGDIGCCCGFYCEEGFNINIMYDDLNNNELLHNEYLRPSISQVLKWLRSEKKIYCLPHFEQGIDMWFFYIAKPQAGCEFPEYMSESIYDTYEQAALAGIEYVLDNLI